MLRPVSLWTGHNWGKASDWRESCSLSKSQALFNPRKYACICDESDYNLWYKWYMPFVECNVWLIRNKNNVCLCFFIEGGSWVCWICKTVRFLFRSPSILYETMLMFYISQEDCSTETCCFLSLRYLVSYKHCFQSPPTTVLFILLLAGRLRTLVGIDSCLDQQYVLLNIFC